MKIKKYIYLNSGHSDLEPGALSLYGVERDLNIMVTDELIPLLERNDFKVEYVPDNLKLLPSINWINNKTSYINDGLALAIHFNKGGGTGAETYSYPGSSVSEDIATKLLNEYCKITGLKNRGVKSKNLAFVRETNIWAVLHECGFMDSAKDMEYVIDNFDKVAEGIARGICAIYNIKYKEEEETDKGRIKEEIIKLVKLL